MWNCHFLSRVCGVDWFVCEYELQLWSKNRNWKFFALCLLNFRSQRVNVSVCVFFSDWIWSCVAIWLCFNCNCKSDRFQWIIYENFHFINNVCLLIYEQRGCWLAKDAMVISVDDIFVSCVRVYSLSSLFFHLTE